MDTQTEKLTAAEIDAMPAGPEMDALVAERVMGWHMYHYDKDVPSACYWMLLDSEGDPAVFEVPYNAMEKRTEAEAWAACPKFSTDIAAAWTVFEKLPGPERRLHDSGQGVEGRYVVKCNAHSWGAGTDFAYYADDERTVIQIEGEANTTPLAICRAALKATLSQKPE